MLEDQQDQKNLNQCRKAIEQTAHEMIKEYFRTAHIIDDHGNYVISATSSERTFEVQVDSKALRWDTHRTINQVRDHVRDLLIQQSRNPADTFVAQRIETPYSSPELIGIFTTRALAEDACNRYNGFPLDWSPFATRKHPYVITPYQLNTTWKQ